ncbi:MAG: ATP-binding protein [Nitrospirota bacterium]|jgi:hypothetical protein
MSQVDIPDVLIHIDETLDHDHLQAIAETVRQMAGVVTVSFHDDKPHLMIVQYVPDEIDAASVLERVRDKGVHAELVGL